MIDWQYIIIEAIGWISTLTFLVSIVSPHRVRLHEWGMFTAVTTGIYGYAHGATAIWVKWIIAFLLSVALLLPGCAPVPIRQHEAVEKYLPEGFSIPKSRCDGFWTDFGSGVYQFANTEDRFFVRLRSLSQSDSIGLQIQFGSGLGKKFLIDGKTIQYKYEGEDWTTVAATIESIEDTKWWLKKPDDRVQAKKVILSGQNESAFAATSPYEINDIFINASIPFKKKNIEIKIPNIQMNSKNMPVLFQYEWHNRWTISPLNGC